MRLLLSLAIAVFFAGPPLFAQAVRIRPILGGLPADSGFSLGAEVARLRAAGPANIRFTAMGSVKKYYLLEPGFEVPNLGRWLYLDVKMRYRNYPEEDFWGLGPDTPEDARTNYLLEDFDTTALLGTAWGRFRAGASGGFLKINTGPGRDDRFPSTPESRDIQPSYGHGGPYFQYNSQDQDSDPRTGGNYTVRAETFAFKFQRYVVDLRQFVPLTENNRLGFRMLYSFTQQSSGDGIPFFMLPTAGGSDTVRGFSQYRFRDRNAFVLNAEYRRPAISVLDAVVFVDAGRVFSNPANLGLANLHASAGLGARLKLGGRVFFGVDVGFSKEGSQLWFRSGHLF